MTSSVLLRRTSDDLLRVAVAAYLARYKGLSRAHTDPTFRSSCAGAGERDLDPWAARRVDVELFVRWLQEARRFKPSTVSRRLSVVICFYRTCVIDAILDYSPAAYVCRPSVPAETPTLGLSHLQFEAMIVAARTSINPFDFALVAMLGLLGLRIFEACAASIDDLGEEHGHRVLRVCGKGSKVVLVPLSPAVGRAIDRAVGDRLDGPILLNRTGGRMDRHAATRRLRHLARTAGVRMPRMHPHMLRHTFVRHAALSERCCVSCIIRHVLRSLCHNRLGFRDLLRIRALIGETRRDVRDPGPVLRLAPRCCIRFGCA
jgi:integrase/recombinase XerD